MPSFDTLVLLCFNLVYNRALLATLDLASLTILKSEYYEKNTFLLLCSLMAWIIVGLGNPGYEYDETRHNTGRMAVEYFARLQKFREFREDKRSRAHVSSGLVRKTAVALVLPNTFMNASGSSVSKFIKNARAAERLIIVHDDLDIPLGSIRISYNRGSGGHNGLESIMRALKTKNFVRVRIGVSPSTTTGRLRKPKGDQVVRNFLLTKFRAHELEEIKRVFRRVAGALETIILTGRERAMSQFN